VYVAAVVCRVLSVMTVGNCLTPSTSCRYTSWELTRRADCSHAITAASRVRARKMFKVCLQQKSYKYVVSTGWWKSWKLSVYHSLESAWRETRCL